MNAARHLTVALVLFGSAGVVAAQSFRDDAPRERRGVVERAGDRTARPMDGRALDRAEPSHRQRLLERFDTDGDGELSDTERAAAKETIQAEREAHRAEMKARLLERFDDNGDGELDEAERETIREVLGPMIRERAERGRRDDHRRDRARREAMQRFDTNEDGRLDEDERAAAKAHFEQKKAEVVARFDADGDGELDDAERQAARAHHREKRRLDINRDGSVDAADIDAATDRLAAGERVPDLNEDGTSDAADLTLLIERVRMFED